MDGRKRGSEIELAGFLNKAPAAPPKLPVSPSPGSQTRAGHANTTGASNGKRPPYTTDSSTTRSKNETAVGNRIRGRMNESGGRPAALMPRAKTTLVAKKESPWNSFRPVYELKINGFVTVAVGRDDSCDPVSVKAFPAREGAAKIAMLRRLGHDRFLRTLACFSFESQFHVVFEHVPISLVQIVVSPPYPTERELAAILGQIIDGLVFLESLDLEHGSLECSNVLITPEGFIRISDQESCQQRQGNASARDAKAVGFIAMELMQKFPQENGRLGIEDTTRWRHDSEALSFLSMTTSVSSVKELSTHPLLKCQWRPAELKWIVALATATVSRLFKYVY